jgi:hypothetical protein
VAPAGGWPSDVDAGECTVFPSELTYVLLLLSLAAVVLVVLRGLAVVWAVACA